MTLEQRILEWELPYVKRQYNQHRGLRRLDLSSIVEMELYCYWLVGYWSYE